MNNNTEPSVALTSRLSRGWLLGIALAVATPAAASNPSPTSTPPNDSASPTAGDPARPAPAPASTPQTPWQGEPISLNFQDVEVRAALQLIADLAGQNLVASDSIAGDITLRLQDVPWDQALDLVLRTRGLAQRRTGNVLLVAPADEMAEREQQEHAARQQAAELEPLHTEFIRVRYADVEQLAALLQSDAGGLGGALAGDQGGTRSGVGVLSGRGSVRLDTRTNSLVVTDIAASLEGVHELVRRLDIPIRQVMIEARIVIAQSDASRQLGIRWGGGYAGNASGGTLTASAGLENLAALGAEAGNLLTPGFPSALLVDLGAPLATSSFALGYASSDLFLAAELSALEAQGAGEVISQPKVITGDKQKASIKSGTEVPYQESSANGETTVAFKEAVLRLDVTPNITPDNRVLLELSINQDSVGALVPSGSGGAIPTIDTTELVTQVLVGDGETVVLGGVFRTEDVESTASVPLLGSIPFLGRLFRNSRLQQTKTETLIFVTPRILAVNGEPPAEPVTE